MRAPITFVLVALLCWACTDERPASEQAASTESTGMETENAAGSRVEPASETETEAETDTDTETEAETEAEAEIDPALRPVPGETSEAAVARCEATDAPDMCITLALDTRDDIRARELERLIAAHHTLENEERMLDHMAAFVTDYPYDRRSNRYRMALRQAGRL